MSDSRTHIVGVDIGGTKIAAGVVSFPEGKLLNRKVIPTLIPRTGDEVLADVERLVHEVITGAGQRVVSGICGRA